MLTWDFTRQISAQAEPGSTVSYLDTSCQAFYLADNSIKTQLGNVADGQWQNTVYDTELIVSDPGYSAFDIEHNFNNMVFGSAYHDGDVVMLLYEYRIDATSIIESGVLQLQTNNSIKVAALSLVKGIVTRISSTDHSIFAPGVEIDLSLAYDNEDVWPLWNRMTISGNKYNEVKELVVIKSKNHIAIDLHSQTFDDHTIYSGTLTSVIAAVLADAGIDDPQIEQNAMSASVTFKEDQNILDGLSEFCDLYGWFVDATDEDNIVVGSDAFIQTIIPLTIYTFIAGDDVFSRGATNSIDSIYSRVCVRRGGASPLNVYGDIPTHVWYVPMRKTFYKEVPDDTTQEAMESIRDKYVANMKYSGGEETFTTAFRPTLRIGDGAIIHNDKEVVLSKGIITDVQHSFGKALEPFTQFTVYTGGTMSDTPPTLTSKYVQRLGHMDRRQTLLKYLDNTDRR